MLKYITEKSERKNKLKTAILFIKMLISKWVNR